MKLIYILFISLIMGCNNTEDLTNQVREAISKELSENNLEKFGLETNVISFGLVEKGNNEYVGILKTNEFRRKGSKYYNSIDTNYNSFYYEYDVSVIADGKNIMWQIENKRRGRR